MVFGAVMDKRDHTCDCHGPVGRWFLILNFNQTLMGYLKALEADFTTHIQSQLTLLLEAMLDIKITALGLTWNKAAD
ncbi:MAG: hypothetical protein AAFW82_00550 [Pseudomonadota bacterium]